MGAEQRLRLMAAAAFDHQDRFIARGAARGGDKAPRVAQVFEIEQNGAGFAVARQKIEQIVNVGIQAIAQRDKP